MHKSILKLWSMFFSCMGFSKLFSKKKNSKKKFRKCIHKSISKFLLVFFLCMEFPKNFFKKKITKIQENECMNFSSHFPMHKKITQLFSMIFLCMGFLNFFFKKKIKKNPGKCIHEFLITFSYAWEFSKKKSKK